MSSSHLSPLQHQFLTHFFRLEYGFFLTGGAALAGYHLQHRDTDDLDLFTADTDAFERARSVVGAIADELGLSLTVVQNAPGFLRVLLDRAEEAVIVDLVLERVPQLNPDKMLIGQIRIGPPEEILANKLTTLVGRSEERDLIDVMLLEQAGYRVEDALGPALRKDGGCTPATLAWTYLN